MIKTIEVEWYISIRHVYAAIDGHPGEREKSMFRALESKEHEELFIEWRDAMEKCERIEKDHSHLFLRGKRFHLKHFMAFERRNGRTVWRTAVCGISGRWYLLGHNDNHEFMAFLAAEINGD